MTHEERLVWSVLRHHLGKARAITNRQLAQQTGLPDRIMRLAKEGLRVYVPIAFCAQGSYVIETEAEFEEAISMTSSYLVAFALEKRRLEQALQRKQTGDKNQLHLAFEEVSRETL